MAKKEFKQEVKPETKQVKEVKKNVLCVNCKQILITKFIVRSKTFDIRLMD